MRKRGAYAGSAFSATDGLIGKGALLVVSLQAVLLVAQAHSFAAQCGTAAPKFRGRLCGPPDVPCVVVGDEDLPAAQAQRNGAPALAIDQNDQPRIVYSEAFTGFPGYFAMPAGDHQWAIEPLSFPVAVAALVLRDSGQPYALVSDGSPGPLLLWSRDHGEWKLVDRASGTDGTLEGFSRDDVGCLYAVAYGNDPVEIGLARRTDSWTFTPVARDANVGTLALASSGEPQMAYWAAPDAHWVFYWAAPPGPPSVIYDSRNNVLPDAGMYLAVIDGPLQHAQPHVLFKRAIDTLPGAAGHTDLAYATRAATGAWEIRPIAQDSYEESGPDPCNTIPEGEGRRCRFSSEWVTPWGIIAGEGGNIRMLFSRRTDRGDRVSKCTIGEPGIYCYWSTEQLETHRTLEVAWADGDSIERAVVAGLDVEAVGHTARVDSRGRIHIAVYDTVHTTADPALDCCRTSVRYIVLGSPQTASPSGGSGCSLSASGRPTRDSLVLMFLMPLVGVFARQVRRRPLASTERRCAYGWHSRWTHLASTVLVSCTASIRGHIWTLDIRLRPLLRRRREMPHEIRSTAA